jgi:hypothetical protein
VAFWQSKYLTLLRPSSLKVKLLLNDGLAMTKLRVKEEKIKPADSRHCEACRIDCTSLLFVMASRSKLKKSFIDSWINQKRFENCSIELPNVQECDAT